MAHATSQPASHDAGVLPDGFAQRLAVLLPPMYRDRYEQVEPVSMGSAGLRFDAQGRVEWDRMWGSFCNLAMAGGPPHKGRLLEPASRAAAEAEPARYAEVTAEIVRGLRLAAGIEAAPGSPGWVRLQCADDTMAAWMLRAIVMENVSARGWDDVLELPAGPGFRLQKEIKNVITVAAKTAHYWRDHMPRPEQFAVAQLLAVMEAEQPLLIPEATASPAEHDRLRDVVGRAVFNATGLAATGLPASSASAGGWIGFDCPDVETAVSMMRSVALSNVLTRREDATLFVPLHRQLDPHGMQAAAAIRRAQRLRVTAP